VDGDSSALRAARRRLRRFLRHATTGAVACAAALAAACATPTAGARLERRGDAIDARLGSVFATYLPHGQRRPVVWPLTTADGIPVTRAFPFAEVAGEPTDHPHHESLWFGHGSVNGVDFWQGDGRVVETDTQLLADGAVRGEAVWNDGQGREVCRDRHEVRFSGGDGWRAVDLDLTLRATAGELKLGDTKEGTFAVRLRPELCLTGAHAGATASNSEGVTGAAIWGKRARWVAYTGLVRGERVTVAMFDRPGNPSYPTYWHARDYGLCAANPFGVHDFTGGGAAKDSGERVVPAGGELRFRYRVFVATGALGEAIDAAWRRWLAEGGGAR
jgi:hypothetical protein